MGRAWTDDKGNQYPSNWLALTTDAEKKAVGLVWEDDPKLYDRRFYWSIDKPKALDDVKEVDEDGKPVLDEDGNQVITLGLKSQYKAQTKATAKSLLESTDWYIVRKAEDSTTTIPSNVATYRAAVRTAEDKINTAITNASDHAAFVALWDTPKDSDGNATGNAPINDFPKEI